MSCPRAAATFVIVRLVLISALLCPAGRTVEAQSDAVVHIRHAQAMNQSEVNVCDAELQLQRWELDQLKALREDGFASWLDVARQQLLVDVLGQQRKASQDFKLFLQRLLQAAGPASNTEQVDHPQQPSSSFPPITVSLPGSVRLIAWIEPSHVSSNLIESCSTRRPADAKQDDWLEDLARAEQAVASAQDRCRVYSQFADEAEAACRLKRAEYQLALARAELKRLHVEQTFLRRGQRTGARRDAALAALKKGNELDAEGSTFGEASHHVTAASHRDLLDATLRVAAAEAGAVGELQAAQITLQEQLLRLAAYQQLRSEGHASASELDAARNQVIEAETLVEDLQSRQAILEQSYKKLLESRPEDESSLSGRTSPASAAVEMPDFRSWPLPLVTDPMMVRHLVDLRRHYYETVSHRDALSLKSALLMKYCTKLEAIETAPPSPTPRANFESASVDQLEATFAAGRRRELQFLKSDIQYQQACGRAASERLRIIALEEARLLQQCVRQQQVPRPIRVAGNGCDDTGLQAVAFSTPGGRFSYFESRDAHLYWRVCELAFSTADIEIVRFAYQPRGVPASPPVQIGIDRSCNRFRPLDCYGSAYTIFGQVNACLRFGSALRRDTLRSRTVRYDACDPFGTRRIDACRSRRPGGT